MVCSHNMRERLRLQEAGNLGDVSRNQATQKFLKGEG